MGLDNGICVKRNEKSMKIYDKLQCFEEDWSKKYDYDFEMAYWRKCWNVRDTIFRCIGRGEDNGDTPINRDDVRNIVVGLEAFNEKTWDTDYSIWEWEEQEPHMKRYIENLEYLYELMAEHDLDVYFYDSY